MHFYSINICHSIKGYVTSLEVSLNSYNMIAPDRPLVKRLTCPSLRLRYNSAVPLAGAGETDDKNRTILQYHT